MATVTAVDEVSPPNSPVIPNPFSGPKNLIKKYHHIINPKTGWPAGECKSVSVAYKRAFDADILSTAIFVLGPEEGKKLIESIPDLEGMIVDSSGKVYISSGWKKECL